MAITFEQLKTELLGKIRILPPASLGGIINDALKDIYKSNEWGFLRTKGYLRTPAMIEAGTASVTKFSRVVTLDAVASAAIMAIAAEDVPLEERQFRNSSDSANTGNQFNYNITAYDPSDPLAITLLIDPPYLDETNAAINYRILKVFYQPPSILVGNDFQIDFKNWLYFISLKLQKRLYTDTTLDQVNKYDFARRYIDDPRHVVAVPPNNDEVPLFELYPAPKWERVYEVIFQRKGLKLTKEEDQVLQLDEDLILKRAEYQAYMWLLANSHAYPELKGSAGRFQSLIALNQNPNDMMSYNNMLQRAIKEDEENYPKAYFGDYSRMSFVDSFIGNYPYSDEFGSEYGSGLPFNVALINF